MKKPNAVLLAGLAVAVILWALFRPEKLFLNKTVSEALPASMAAASTNSTSTASGMFHSVAHETQGTAAIFQQPDGKRILRLTNFKTSNGPDVHVYLVAAKDATDSDSVNSAGFIELGSLKGNEGDQNYDVPANIDLAKYSAVTIWCKRFGVNFGTAPLTHS